MNDNSFEKFPDNGTEIKNEREVPPDEDFAENFKDGVPSFAGEQLGVANEDNQFYGESVDERESKSETNEESLDATSSWSPLTDEQIVDFGERYNEVTEGTEDEHNEPVTEQESEPEDNEGVREAFSIAGYGLDAVAREKGVEFVVQGIKSFDVNGSDNPLRDLLTDLGVESVEDFKEVRDEVAATKQIRDAFRAEYDVPITQGKMKHNIIKAISSMKELIAEVEGADPRYAELRSAAEAAGKGYFEYAVMSFEKRGLTELFTFLNEQHERKEPSEQVESLKVDSSESEGAVL